MPVIQGCPWDETAKTEATYMYHSMCDNKYPSCSKACSAEPETKFCSPSLVMMTSTYECNILERDIKPLTSNQPNLLQYTHLVLLSLAWL